MGERARKKPREETRARQKGMKRVKKNWKGVEESERGRGSERGRELKRAGNRAREQLTFYMTQNSSIVSGIAYTLNIIDFSCPMSYYWSTYVYQIELNTEPD